EERYEHFDNGLESAKAFFDEKGMPAAALGKMHRMSFAYNPHRQLTSQRFWGVDDKPILVSVGCHEIRQAFDEQHRLGHVECRGPDGELRVGSMVHGGVAWPAGAAQVNVERGASLTNIFLGPTGEVVKRVDCSKAQCYR